ncbi:hypothetical protein RHGRI_017321 [Rhododendron griersonianum]|uniref:RING-type E3 ubiquitin transferase n=1 Tax=Rhododendron griersonianum TaxID=479676 RepID=A0AAV6JXF8_9ERIC|nr:hypothetical protein RHGRI_017321 [Rhododendron griersonianum]
MKELHSSGSSTTNNKMLIFLLLLFFFLSPTGGGAGAIDRDPDDECNKPAMCGDKGSKIRFPFWLKGVQPERYGYGPGFALTCSPTNNSETLVDLPFFVKAVVKDIDYGSQELTYQFSSCFPHQNLSLIINTSPFLPISYSRGNSCEYYIFSCPSLLDPDYYYYKYATLPCLSRPGHHLYLMKSESIRQNLLNCTKMHTIPSVPCIYLGYLDFPGNLTSWWNGPEGCWKCEEEGKYCRGSSSNNSKKHETECFNPKPPRTREVNNNEVEEGGDAKIVKKLNNNEVEEGGDAKIVKKLTVIGLWCIQWYPGDRPSMKAVVQMLEGDGDTLGMPPNPFSTTNGSITRGNMGGRHFSSILEIISESD